MGVGLKVGEAVEVKQVRAHERVKACCCCVPEHTTHAGNCTFSGRGGGGRKCCFAGRNVLWDGLCSFPVFPPLVLLGCCACLGCFPGKGGNEGGGGVGAANTCFGGPQA